MDYDAEGTTNIWGWREFYRATTTRQRLNHATQRGHMPKKYWKHLVENPGAPLGAQYPAKGP